MAERILLDHGSGGKIANRLIRDLLLPAFDDPELSRLNDGAILETNGLRIAFSTDSFVVEPLFFPGGNIGDLAVNGTVNDIAMCGAVPLYLSTGLILEEGFDMGELSVIVDTMGRAARGAGVRVVTGDTKVVPGGAADKLFINTSGIGIIPAGVDIAARRAEPGDLILLSGTIADHGMAVLARREGLTFETTIVSDTAPLNRMVAAMLAVTRNIHTLRDPTRGGVGAILNEIAQSAGVGIRIWEEKIPLRPEVGGLCELLGFDPLFVANEGKLVAFVPEAEAEAVLEAIRHDPLGENACIIGRVLADSPGRVVMETRIGGTRLIDTPAGEQLPRIC
ncbi:MAG: hydrogenase expression/formation protein HypE [Thermodesulfobacteriota bacterium]